MVQRLPHHHFEEYRIDFTRRFFHHIEDRQLRHHHQHIEGDYFDHRQLDLEGNVYDRYRFFVEGYGYFERHEHLARYGYRFIGEFDFPRYYIDRYFYLDFEKFGRQHRYRKHFPQQFGRLLEFVEFQKQRHGERRFNEPEFRLEFRWQQFTRRFERRLVQKVT